jgi:hypothetical protein
MICVPVKERKDTLALPAKAYPRPLSNLTFQVKFIVAVAESGSLQPSELPS